MNRKLVEVGNSHYAFKAYLLNLLNFGYEAKKTWLQSGFFYKDTLSETINVSEINNFNFGYLQRRDFFIESKGKVNILTPIHWD